MSKNAMFQLDANESKDTNFPLNCMDIITLFLGLSIIDFPARSMLF